MKFAPTIAGALCAIALGTNVASAMPDAETMKRLETVAFYIGAIDHCELDVSPDRLVQFFRENDATDPVTFGALDSLVTRGSLIRHRPGSSHCIVTEQIMKAEGIID